MPFIETKAKKEIKEINGKATVVLTPECEITLKNLKTGQEYMSDAEADADARTNKLVWFLFGCVGNVFTVAYTYFYEPSPPAGPLLGKSPEYVAYYTDAYTIKAKNLQVRNAMIGCVTSALIWGAVVIAATIAEEESSSGYYYYY